MSAPVNTPETIRQAVLDAVRHLMRASAPTERMTHEDVTQLVEFVATASVGIVLARIAAEMRTQVFDETASGAARTADEVLRELGYRAGSNDTVRRWSKLLTEAVHAGG